MVQRVQSEAIRTPSKARRSAARMQRASQRSGTPPDDEWAEREIDAIVARLDIEIARERQPGDSQPRDLMDRITRPFQRLSSAFDPTFSPTSQAQLR